MPPIAGPSTQMAPPATFALLHSLAPAHERVFPVQLAPVRPDTNDDDSTEARKEMVEKAALLRVVLGGWMEGLGTEEGKSGCHTSTSTSEMITGLSSSIGGPLQYLQAKPRVLIFRARPDSDDTVAALPHGPGALPAGTNVDGAALSTGEDDLATFLLPRILRAAASLQAALLASPTPRQDVLQTATTRLWRERSALLAQLEDLLATMIGVLAESGVRLDWQGPDGVVQGGLGKAREMAMVIIKLLRDLLPSAHDSPTPFPRNIHLSESISSRAMDGADPFDGNRPSITVQSTLHARALHLTSVRILRKVTSISPFLADLAPQVTDIIFDGWPSGWSAGAGSVKGKERADDNRARAVAASLEIIADTIQDPVQTFSARMLQLSAIRAGEALDGRLVALERESVDEVVDARIDDALARIYARLWRTLREDEHSEGALEQLSHILATSLTEHGDHIVECLVQPLLSVELRLACLFAITFPLGPTVPTPALAVVPLNQPPPQTATTDLLSVNALHTLTPYTTMHQASPLALPPSLSHLISPAEHAWSRLCSDIDSSTGDASTVNGSRKRKRDAEPAQHPSSDVMDLDGMPLPTAMRRKKAPWREAVVKVLKLSSAGEELNLEAEGVEKMIARLAQSIPSASTEQAINALKTIGLLSCARDGSLAFVPPSTNPTSTSDPTCAFCDSFGSGVSESSRTGGARVFTDAPISAMRAIARTVLVGDADPKTRLAFLKTLPRLLRHSRANAGALALDGTDELVNLVYVEAEAATRTSRMAAGNVLSAITQSHQENDPSASFVSTLFTELDRLLDKGRPAIVETALNTIGKLARLSTPQGLLECTCLERFVSRLGHPNTFLKSVARTQLEQVAAHRDIKTYALIQPHFATISPLLISSKPTAPAILAAALDCFHQSHESLLRITREYTLPTIVAQEQKQMLEQVATASGQTIPQMLTIGSTAAAVLAYLYMRPDAETTKRGLDFYLKEVNSLGNTIRLGQLLGSVRVPLVYKLALELGDLDPVIAAQAERALKNVQRSSEGLASKAKVELGTILKESIVGILSHMNRGLNESSTHRPLRDKQRIIRSLEAITVNVGPAIAGFSPQIMATLQSALEVKGLRGVTISAFKAFIESLKFAEIGPFIGPTTATFVRLWPEFSHEERATATKMIEYIVQNLDGLSKFVHEIADLSNVPELASAHRSLVEIRKDWSFGKKTRYLLARIASENDVVTLQALKELKALMAGNRAKLQELASGDSFNSSVGPLVKNLFDSAVRDGPENRQIRNMAFECIGILGALDPDRFELPPAEPPFIVLQNFTDLDESILFALHLIENLLIGAYRSTNDTKHQEFLAYAIQELLSFCGFTADLVLPSSSSKSKVDPAARERWDKLPKNVLETCGPLLGGSFSFKERSMPREAQYPIYSSTSSYRDWIRIFANDLILKLEGDIVKKVFGAFPPVLHLEDIAVARHLLPHLVLNALIAGSDSDRSRVKTEIETVLTDQVSPVHQLSENSRILSAQTVFDLMDHLSRWITLARKRLQENKSRKKAKGKVIVDKEFEAALLNVEGILQDIPHILVGQAALTCKAYARSLLNFESHIVAQRAQKDNVGDENLQEYYENLHECYADLDEPDGMEGISTKIISPSVLHQIREHESTGRWTSAQSCWEVKLQQKPDEPANHVGLLRCLRNLGHYDSMRTHIIGILHSRSDEADWDRILAPFNIEASLFIGDWEAVEDALRIADIEGAEVSFGKVISAMKEGNNDLLSQAFFEAREQLGHPIVAAGKESYRRVYDSVIHLHILQELEAIHLAREQQPDSLSDDLIKSLSLRLASTSPSFRAREPILNMRRTAFRIGATASARDEIAELWLETSKIARKAGHTQTAYSAILQARDLSAEFVFLQSAKLAMATDQPYKALQDLDNALRSKIPPNFGREDFVDRASQPIVSKGGPPGPLAKASLRRARWMVEAGRLDYNEAVVMYSESSKLAPDWESPHYYLGRYCDEYYKRLSLSKHARSENVHSELSYIRETVSYFSIALTHGTKFIYQAMPRMLTLWLEFGERPKVLEIFKQRAREGGAFQPQGDDWDLLKCFESLNKTITRAVRDLPSYQWLTVLPQLVSRILHPNVKVGSRLKDILLKVLSHYPHHGFWAMASGAKSTTAKRSAANMDILERAKAAYKKTDRRGDNTARLIDQGLKLVDELLALCNHNISKTDSLSLRKIFPRLAESLPDDLYIPLQSSLTVSLPSDASQFATHRPFPSRLPTFHSFDDTIVIMTSLQRPRKITVWGSDGKQYSFLCKPKDDLRKDARLMEFNSMIIKLLKKDGDARNRRLDIRTYAVVPLNEDCGLIEWVPHVVVLRGILNKSYQARGIAPWGPELKRTFDTIRDDPKKTGDRFVDEVLKNYPPVFHEWFLENFPEPSAWLRARLAYSRTAAVISIVGFVLGLGDRHCENILLDGTTGDTVHVDFNCLFDRGRTFDVAEQVPFRLTHNIIDGMGVSGVEGVYRRAAEITLRILRDNKDSLMSVLETFLHDPLVEWVPSVSKRDPKPASEHKTADHVRSKAKNSLGPIDNKLSGLQVTSSPLSLGAKEVGVGEQVERLIREARDPKNLGSMYVGWCAWF